MKITETMLRRVAPNVHKEHVKDFVKVFNDWSDNFEINTPMRMCGFLANIFHESACLALLEENLNYSEQGLLKVFPKYFNAQSAALYARKPQMIANRVYANRMGNGSEESGDGWRYKGRGAIQITGRNTYKGYADSEYCVGDLMHNPEWLAKSPGAYKSAMWFWKANGLNLLADRGDMESMCKRINGGLNGFANRMYYYRKFKKEFGL